MNAGPINSPKLTMVRYRVLPERLDDHLALAVAVYDELHEVQPDGLMYATFRVAGERDFVHLAVVEEGLETHPLTSRSTFQRFNAGISSRCEVQPVAVQVNALGSYRFGL